MASDSEQFARKLHEINSWLSRLDGILASSHPIGQTLDVLESQHQTAMDGLKELSKYGHHIRFVLCYFVGFAVHLVIFHVPN